jgi:integrase
MTRIRLDYVHRFRDRHGKLRSYFRRAGFKRVPLPGLPGSAEFMEAYGAALAGEAGRLEVGARRIIPGTATATVLAYLGSTRFALLAPDTRTVRASILQRLAKEHGDKRVALLQRDHVQWMLDAKAATPGAARNFLTAMRVLMRFAMDAGLRADNPTVGITSVKVRSDGWHTWTEDEIAAFEATHPIGSMARLALALLLYTAQRRSDIVRMGRQHVRNGSIQVRQHKTGTELSIPIHPALQAVLDGTPSEQLTFLTMSGGKPFTPAGFTQWFRARCQEAGLPKGVSAHGLRKAACRRLAEAGCSANVIASISGHASLREVERYTRAADRARMAKAGIEAVTGAFGAVGKRTLSGKP